jgi:hypothetical protein
MKVLRPVQAAVAAVAIAATLGASTASAGDIEIRRDGSKAVDVPVAWPAPNSPEAADGFHLADAGVGAAGMLAVALGFAGAVSLRARRRPLGAR